MIVTSHGGNVAAVIKMKQQGKVRHIGCSISPPENIHQTDGATKAQVEAMQIVPTNRRVVHHTLNFIDTTGQARKLEQAAQAKARATEPSSSVTGNP